MDAAELAWSAAGAPYPLEDVPKPTDLPDLSKPGVPLVTDVALRQARYIADRLDYLSGVVHDEGMRTWLNDGSISLRDLADAVEEMQRPLQ